MKISLTIQQLSKITATPIADLEKQLIGEDGEPLETAPDLVVEKVGDRVKETTQRQFDIATSKVSKKLEKIFKAAGVEEFENVEDAAQKLADMVSEKGEGTKSVDLDQLKITDLAKVPAFQAYRDSKDAEVANLKTEIENTVKTVERRETAVKVRSHSFSHLDAKLAKYIDKEMQLDAILNFIPIDRLKWEDKEKDFILLNADGEPELDASANPIKYLDTLSDNWGRLYGFNETDPNKKTPGAKPNFGKDTPQKIGIKFDSYEDALNSVKRAGDLKTRTEMQRAMNEQFPEGKPKT